MSDSRKDRDEAIEAIIEEWEPGDEIHVVPGSAELRAQHWLVGTDCWCIPKPDHVCPVIIQHNYAH